MDLLRCPLQCRSTLDLSVRAHEFANPDAGPLNPGFGQGNQLVCEGKKVVQDFVAPACRFGRNDPVSDYFTFRKTNDAASDPSGESIDAMTIALSMNPRRKGGMICPTKCGTMSSGRETGRCGC